MNHARKRQRKWKREPGTVLMLHHLEETSGWRATTERRMQNGTRVYLAWISDPEGRVVVHMTSHAGLSATRQAVELRLAELRGKGQGREATKAPSSTNERRKRP